MQGGDKQHSGLPAPYLEVSFLQVKFLHLTVLLQHKKSEVPFFV